MTQSTEVEFERRVAETIEKLNYKVTTEPLRGPEHSSWQDRISSWLMEPSYPSVRPDMLVAHGAKLALVEAKAYPVLLGPVIQARHFADYFNIPAIVCVPDDALQKIPESVLEWAHNNDIVLSTIGEIGDKLEMVLQETST